MTSRDFPLDVLKELSALPPSCGAGNCASLSQRLQALPLSRDKGVYRKRNNVSLFEALQVDKNRSSCLSRPGCC